MTGVYTRNYGNVLDRNRYSVCMLSAHLNFSPYKKRLTYEDEKYIW